MKKNTLRLALAMLCLTATPAALSHLVKEQPMQSYRQSYYAMIGMNFGIIYRMVKGDVPWNEEILLERSSDLAALTNVDVLRAFRQGSEEGTTRAKPEIWENFEDYTIKSQNLRVASEALLKAAGAKGRKSIGAATRETATACKSCHDEYKAKHYLY